MSLKDKPPTDFRLRSFVQGLDGSSELQRVDREVDMLEVAKQLDANRAAVHFRSLPKSVVELVGNVMGSRSRLAAAFGVPESGLLQEVIERVAKPIAPRIVPSSEAPVHEVILQGEEADFTRLPVHLQHAEDGAPYISASIDIAESLDGKRRNVGYRRMMLRGRKEAGIDLIAPSDLRVIYEEFRAAGKRMPIVFVVGSHPVDCYAAVCQAEVDDEVSLMGAMRQQAVPMVKCKSIDAYAPADAEVVLEGYLDELGWREEEGPFGEFLGYVGMVKRNPVFHLTAITMRRDALFQTATIGGKYLGRTDTAQLCALRTEATAWTALKTAVREPRAVYCSPSSGGMFNLRVALRQRYPGEASNAMAAVFGSVADVKNVFVVDDDIDIFSDEQMEWALATRFQPARDLTVFSGMRAMPLDPSLEGARVGSKAGFNLMLPFGRRGDSEFAVPKIPEAKAWGRSSVKEALSTGAQTFFDLMQASGTSDGRDVVIALDELRQQGALQRTPEGKYALK
ncbi:MAG TPA: UbiD family decarboxylase [Ramlibacter sp.]|nr:UbiD family decarboxylase [Ramlibacter sp.]